MRAVIPKLKVDAALRARPLLDEIPPLECVARHLHADDGVAFVSSAGEILAGRRVMHEPWVGLVPDPSPTDASISEPGPQASLATCLGLWVQSEDARRRLERSNVAVPVAVVRGGGAALLDALTRTALYWSLPVPPSQKGAFRSFDVTVLICSHSRVGDLGRLLSRFADQDYAGTFEVLLWNNNRACLASIEELCAQFGDRLELKTIHSSENYFCLPRLAVAGLMRSDRLLICDDDVLPGRGFVSRFLTRFERYGPDAAVCARGHLFLAHTLDEEQPDRVWAEHRMLRFFDEHDDDRRVHYLHAGSCLLPRHLLTTALGFEMEHEEFALVDDYWLSFVLGHHLDVPVWKIRADDVLALTASSDDPSVALFHNPAVRHERVRFYIHHMRAGWPDFDHRDRDISDARSLGLRRRRWRMPLRPHSR